MSEPSALFNYLLIITGIITGMAVTRIIAGIGAILIKRDSCKVYWVHLTWSLTLLLLLLQTWYNHYNWGTDQNKAALLTGFGGFLASLLFPIILYFAAIILFPNTSAININNYREYYYRHCQMLFAVGALALLFLLISDNFLTNTPEPVLRPANILRFVLFLLLLLVYRSSSPRVHGIVALLVMLLLLIFCYHNTTVDGAQKKKRCKA